MILGTYQRFNFGEIELVLSGFGTRYSQTEPDYWLENAGITFISLGTGIIYRPFKETFCELTLGVSGNVEWRKNYSLNRYDYGMNYLPYSTEYEIFEFKLEPVLFQTTVSFYFPRNKRESE